MVQPHPRTHPEEELSTGSGCSSLSHLIGSSSPHLRPLHLQFPLPGTLFSYFCTCLSFPCMVKSHGWRSLVGCSPQGCKESDTTEWLLFRFLLTLQVSSQMLCSQRGLPDHYLEHTSPFSILFSVKLPYALTCLLTYLFICLSQLECKPQEDFCSLLYHQQLSPCLAHNRHSESLLANK